MAFNWASRRTTSLSANRPGTALPVAGRRGGGMARNQKRIRFCAAVSCAACWTLRTKACKTTTRFVPGNALTGTWKSESSRLVGVQVKWKLRPRYSRTCRVLLLQRGHWSWTVVVRPPRPKQRTLQLNFSKAAAAGGWETNSLPQRLVSCSRRAMTLALSARLWAIFEAQQGCRQVNPVRMGHFVTHRPTDFRKATPCCGRPRMPCRRSLFSSCCVVSVMISMVVGGRWQTTGLPASSPR